MAAKIQKNLQPKPLPEWHLIDHPSHTATDGIELPKVLEIQVSGEVELHTARNQPSETKLGQVLVAFLGTKIVIAKIQKKAAARRLRLKS